MISDRTATILITVVTIIWACNVLAGMFEINSYKPSESINGIFLTIVGGAFALRAKGNAPQQPQEAEPPPEKKRNKK